MALRSTFELQYYVILRKCAHQTTQMEFSKKKFLLLLRSHAEVDLFLPKVNEMFSFAATMNWELGQMAFCL